MRNRIPDESGNAPRANGCVTRWQAGVDNAWEQEKLEVWKMPENAAESHTSGARFVGTLLTCKTHLRRKLNTFYQIPGISR